MRKIITVTMPDIGEGVVEGEVVEWLKNVGDELKQDEPVVVVMTDKATVELPAPQPGTLKKLYVQAGEIAVKDKSLYDIEAEDSQAATVSSVKEKDPSPHAAPVKPLENPSAARISEKKSKGLATPPVRHLAKILNIDLSKLQGTGKDGRITKEDLKVAAPKAPVTKTACQEGDEEKPFIGVKRLMAEKMKTSKANIPHFSYFEKVEATRLVALRKHVQAEAAAEGFQATYMPFFIRALSLCINKHPEINSSLEEAESKLILHRHQNIGVAIAGPQGLVVVVLRDVQELTFPQLIRAYEELKKRALASQLKPEDMRGSTITLSNFGVLGGHGLWATPIINYPEAAILAVDRIQKQPAVVNGEIVIRDVLNVSWSFDHRIIDGEMAAHVSRDFCGYLLNPASLL